MAAKWYYSKSGELHGPISWGELIQLARQGILQPTNSLWTEGMSSWQPAGSLRGLFGNESPQGVTNQSAEAWSPPCPPADIHTATNGLWAALAAKGKEIGRDLLHPATNYQRNPAQPGNATAADSSRLRQSGKPMSLPELSTVPSPRTVLPNWAIIAAVGACLVVILVIGILAFVLSRFESTSRSYSRMTTGASGFISRDGTAGFVMKSSDLPPPVSQAIEKGKDVWQLHGYQESDGDQGLYIVLDDGDLEILVLVSRMTRGEASIFYGKENVPGHDVYGWRKANPTHSFKGVTEFTSVEWDWTFTADKNHWILKEKRSVETKPTILTIDTIIDITIDQEVGEGFWRSNRETHTKYRGALARFPDETETENDEGPFWPVPRK